MNSQRFIGITFDCEILSLLEGIAHDHGFKEYTIEKTGESMKGDGYMGVITMLEIRNNPNIDNRKLSLVVKSARISEALREEIPVSDVFKREIYMYESVIPALQQLVTQKGLPQFPSFAKCFKATALYNSEALILENLKTIGFRLWERRIPMDDAHVALVMKEYGRFHAMSFALRDQHLGTFEKLTHDLDDIFDAFIRKNNFMDMLTNGCKKVAETFSSSEVPGALEVFRNFIDTSPEYVLGITKQVDKYSAILHADCWTNNMMFGYDDTNRPKTPTKMCFLDLQICKLGPPVLDLAHFFYACSSKELIDNYQYYLDIYYGSLADYLQQLGSKADKVYPYAIFLKQWKDNARFGLLMAIMVIKVMLSEHDEVADLTELVESGKSVSQAFDYCIANSEEYNTRVRHIILHFVKNKYI